MHGDRLPRHALRHRDAAGLPAGRRAARVQARRPRAGVPRLAGRLRRHRRAPEVRHDRRRPTPRRPPNELTPLADYLGSVLRRLRPLPPLDLDLTQAYGNVLAEDVRRAAPVPGLRPGGDRRVRRPLEDIAARRRGAAPVRLNVVGDLVASSWRPVRLTPGTCFSVAAGAAAAGRRRRGRAGGVDRPGHGRGRDLPGAQARLRACAGPATSWPPARCWRVRAPYVTPALVAVFAATGIGHVVVRPSPRVVIIATGDELVDVGRGSQPGQVVDANSHALTAAAAEAGALAYRVGHLRRRPGGPARAAGGPDPAGRPDHHHRRHRHRPGRHGAADPVARRRQPRGPVAVHRGRRSTRAPRSASARSAARRCRSSACPASRARR